MPVTPDTKNWTWVLAKVCPDCGFDASTFLAQHVGTVLRENVAAWEPILRDPLVRRRPSDSVWSALEYGCHVRDVFRIFDRRLHLMLDENNPLFENWDQDETAVEDRYGEQAPETVWTQLEQAGLQLAASFEGVPDEAWSRPGRRSDGSVFTVDTLARYLLHDPVHHLWDVREGFDQLRG
jgi:DinB superfamily